MAVSVGFGELAGRDSIVMRETVGTAEVEHNGKRYNCELATVFCKGMPVISCTETGNKWCIKWDALLDLAVKEGLLGEGGK